MFGEKVFEFFYKDLNLLVRGIEQMSGKSEGWTWVYATRIYTPEVKWVVNGKIACLDRSTMNRYYISLPGLSEKAIISNAANTVFTNVRSRCYRRP